ncbi:hypothetical protein [Pectobacterium araliae]|uniref:hypothetical protein n=1 Tax=Pectobacterium araliae TaxID=3073862 RepID=UPI0021C3E3AE
METDSDFQRVSQTPDAFPPLMPKLIISALPEVILSQFALYGYPAMRHSSLTSPEGADSFPAGFPDKFTQPRAAAEPNLKKH